MWNFLDFAKAFDCVNHEVLLNKLEHHGVRGNVLSLLRSYLSNRFQYTENRELQITSHQLPITIAVHQVSVLGPFLFLVYINNLPNSCDSKMILYADDSVSLCTDPSVKKLQTKTETEFRNLENWIKLNRQSLNYKKTDNILFSRKKRKPLDNNFSIHTEKGPIEVKSTIKYLGVLIDSKLSWTNHIHHIVNKLSIARGILPKIKHFASKSVLRNVYFGLAYPYLQYGVTSWVNTAVKHLKKLKFYKIKLLRLYLYVFFQRKTFPLHEELKLLKFANIFKLEVLKFTFKIKKIICPTALLSTSAQHPKPILTRLVLRQIIT